VIVELRQTKCASEFGQCRHHPVSAAEDLDGDVVGAGADVFVQPVSDLIGCAMGNDCVD
jgi:hypothetical protein